MAALSAVREYNCERAKIFIDDLCKRNETKIMYLPIIYELLDTRRVQRPEQGDK